MKLTSSYHTITEVKVVNTFPAGSDHRLEIKSYKLTMSTKKSESQTIKKLQNEQGNAQNYLKCKAGKNKEKHRKHKYKRAGCKSSKLTMKRKKSETDTSNQLQNEQRNAQTKVKTGEN